jgi:S1-C subfamily serine protease
MSRVTEHSTAKEVAIIFGLVILILVGSIAAVYVDLKSENESLSSKIDELQGAVNEMQATLNLSSTVSELQAQISELQANLMQLQINLAQVPSAVQVYSQAKLSEVTITTGQGSSASGFVYDSQGYIVTCNHVIQNATAINVTFLDGTIEPAQIIGTPDVYSDLALLKVSNQPAEFKPLPIRNSTSLMVGETVYALGNSLGLTDSMTMGIISQLERVRNASINGGQAFYLRPDIIQFDAAINGGGSGGPLLDSRGNVIGVVFAIDIDDLAQSGFIGVAYAIPSVMILRVISALQTVGHYDHPWVGIEYDSGYTKGAYITRVISGGPADKAGLKAGDVFEQVNNNPIKSGVEFVTFIERYGSPGSGINLTINRNGNIIEKALTLEARTSTQTSP